MKVRALLFSVIAIFLLAACKHGLNESQGEGSVTISINSQIEGAVPAALEKAWAEEKENARTAQPVLPDDILYKVSGLKADGGLVSFENTTENTYKLQFGTYSTVSVAGFIKDSSNAYTLKAFESTETKSITISETNPSENLDFILHPVFGTANGTVSLPVVLEAGSGISKVVAYWTENGSSKSQVLTVSENAATFTMKAVGESDGVKAGVYNVVFAFYKYSGNAEVLAYRAVETINVFSNLATDTWQKAGDSVAYLSDVDADDSLEFYVTLQMIKKFEQLVKYVDQTTGSDANNQGTYFSPFETIQKAVDVIKAQNEDAASDLKGSDFIILLKNDYTDDSTSAYSATNQNALINIASSSEDLNIAISSIDPTSPLSIDANRSAANGTGRVLYVGNKAAVTLEGISITGGYFETGSTNQGAGIYVAPTGTLYLDGKVAVYGSKIGTKDNNLYLPKDTDNSQTVVHIAQALETTVQGKIGITTEIKPSAQNLTVTFTESFGSSNSLTPSNFFVSDEGYSVGYNSEQAEGVIAVSKGSFETEVSEAVTFNISRNVINKNYETKISASAFCDANIDITSDANFQWLTNEIKVYAFGADVTNKITIQNDNGLELVFPAEIFQNDDLIQINLAAEYNNRKYSSSSFTVSVDESFSASDSAALAAYVSEYSSSQTANVCINDLNPDLAVLKTFVNTAQANISLDLRRCTGLLTLPKDCFDISNTDNKLKKLYLPSTVTTYFDMNDVEQQIASPNVGGATGEIDLRYAVLYAPESGSQINISSDMSLAKPVDLDGKIEIKADNVNAEISRASINEFLFTINEEDSEVILGGGNKNLTFKGGCYDSETDMWANGISGAVKVEAGTLTLKENCLFTEYDLKDSGIITISDGVVNINGASITRFKTTQSNSGNAIRCWGGGTVNFSSGLIGSTDDFMNEGYYAAVYVRDGGVFNMSGDALIQNCWGRFGGAVIVNNATFKMTGGVFKNNRAWGNKNTTMWGGGALYTENNGIAILQAGSFIGNYTRGTGSNGTGMPGGAIHATSGSIEISSNVIFSGNKTIKNNTGDEADNGNNFYIDSGVTFYLDGQLVTELPYISN